MASSTNPGMDPTSSSDARRTDDDLMNEMSERNKEKNELIRHFTALNEKLNAEIEEHKSIEADLNSQISTLQEQLEAALSNSADGSLVVERLWNDLSVLNAKYQEKGMNFLKLTRENRELKATIKEKDLEVNRILNEGQNHYTKLKRTVSILESHLNNAGADREKLQATKTKLKGVMLGVSTTILLVGFLIGKKKATPKPMLQQKSLVEREKTVGKSDQVDEGVNLPKSEASTVSLRNRNVWNF